MAVRALYTGSFNPPTLAHRQVLERVLQNLHDIDVVIMPAARMVHKDPAQLAPFVDRLAMARLMAEGLPRTGVSALAAEVDSPETADLVAALQAQTGAARIILVMGADVFSSLPYWRGWQALAAAHSFYIFPRAGSDATQVPMPSARVTMPAALVDGPSWYVDEEFAADASATAARAGADGLLSRAIQNYVAERKLY